MAATTQGTQTRLETTPKKPKDGLLEARRILKRIELLDEPEQLLVLQKLQAKLEAGKEG